MTSPEVIELSARCEALARVVQHLTAELEDRGLLDGPRFWQGLREARPSGSPVMDRAGALLDALASSTSEARANRRTLKLWSENRSGPEAAT